MSPRALEAQLDFVRLTAEEASSLYFERFLRDGFGAWPREFQSRFSGLRDWQGVAGLKATLRRLFEAPPDWPLLLANRSAQLMAFAARAMFGACRHVLTTDLSWPTYQEALEHVANRSGKLVSQIALREALLRGHMGAEEAARRIVGQYAALGCDGLFLPAVDHLGIRLPVAEIAHRLRQLDKLRFLLLDAAQAFCHVPLGDCVQVADFVLAGCHKWLGAYHPLGIGVYGHRRTRDAICRNLEQELRSGDLDDPLLRFTTQLERDQLDGFSETVNLVPLFSCQGAAVDALGDGDGLEATLQRQVQEADQLMPWAERAGWRPLQPAPTLRTGIVLLESRRQRVKRQQPDELRQRMLAAGLVVSTYANGQMRLSLPREGFRLTQWQRISGALNHSGDSVHVMSS